MVQLLHRFQPERGLLPQRRAHQEHGWHHLVRLARLHLFAQESGDEDPARGFQTIEGINIGLYRMSPCKRWAMNSQIIFHFIQYMQQQCTGDVHKHCTAIPATTMIRAQACFLSSSGSFQRERYCVRVG